MKRIFIVDATGFLYRSYFAIQGMTNPQGESTNALYGFIRSLLKLIKDFHPNYLVAVFDGPKNIQRRKEIYPDYKSHRMEAPGDFFQQVGWAQKYCDLMGIPKLIIPEVEADDTMGTIAKWGEHTGVKAYICTSDKDMCQLVTENILILNTHKDNKILDPKGVEEKFGVKPEQIIDYLSIMGDSSDNIPGLSGFGPKTASSLLQKFGSLDYILNHPKEVPGAKKQETIIHEADNARLSRRLVTLDTSVEIPRDHEFFKIKNSKLPELINFFNEMNFKTLIKELDYQMEEIPVDYHLVDDEKKLNDLISFLQTQQEIAFDTETTHLRPLKAELVGIGFSTEPGKGWYIPTNGKLGLVKVLESVKPLFHNSNIGFYGHNVKYDWHILCNYGIQVKNICFDTIIASYLLNSHSRQHSLDNLSLEYFGKVKIPTSDLIGKGKKQISMKDVPIEKVSQYCCEDVDYTLRLKIALEPELKKRKMNKLYYDVELPLMIVLAKMERKGIYINIPLLNTLSVKILSSIDKIKQEIFQMAGEVFNLNSPKQLSKILFEKMEIKPPRKTATGHSTNAEVLEFLKYDYPIAEKILLYRTLEKLRSTYLDVLPEEVNIKTHRIHSTFNQFIAATGRLSSQDPNLQNIPVRTEEGRNIREAFQPERQGWSFLSADYSQIELRILAHLSGDPNLVEAFQNNEDIHTHTASQIFGIPIENVSKEMRYAAKAVNFGVIYGQQAFGLSRELKIPVKEAAEFIKQYFQRYPKIQEFIELSKQKVRETGKAITIIGRERSIPEIHNKNIQIRNAAERLAVNTPIQGTAADLIKLAMLEIDKILEKEQLHSMMILQIHDELIFESPDHELIALENIVKNTMQNIYNLNIPLVVDINIGKNWKEC